jgi:sugar phosphate isomerase/epimerase
MSFGLQTYTIRKYQKKNLEKAYRPLAEMGISGLEIARIDFTRENAIKIKELIDKYGFSPVAIQVKPKHVFGNVDEVVEFCNITGCKNVVISMLPFECILGAESKFYSFVSTLDRQFEIYQSHGITLAYHHHNWEYIKLSNGKSRMAELISKTEKIRFVHDTYWTARCGIDPTLQIKEFGKRLLGVHLRDLDFKKRFLDVLPHDTVVGEGVIDFKRVLSAAKEVGCKYTVIGQKTDKPYEDIKRSLENLRIIETEIKE